MTRLAFGFATLILALSPLHATAQTIVREGDGDVFIDNRLDRLIRRGEYVAFVGESRTIAAGDTISGDLLVLDGEVYVEGTIEGDLVGVDADIYLRPGSVVGGDLVNVGGGLYKSELAEVRRRQRSLPNLPYEVHREGSRVVILSRDERRALELDGFFGFAVPEYNRVDGFHPRFGFTWTARPVLGGFAPGVRANVGYRTEPGDVTGGGSLFLQRERFTLEGGWLRDTFSQDRWIRGDIRNSVDFLIDGDDMRNYYSADVLFGEARYRVGNADAERFVDFGLRYQQEDASTMRGHHPWTAFGEDTLRANPPIDEGTISSFIPFVEAEWVSRTTATDARLSVEQGDFDVFARDILCAPEVLDCGEREGSFTRLRLDSEFAMQAVSDHTLEIELQFMMPLAGDEPLPRQRFGMLGGSSTLRTVPDASMYGDHLAYSETEYIIPLRFIRLPRNIVPEFQLLHMAGLAWTGERDEDEDFVQNVGARLNVWALYARVIVDPAEGEPEFTAGLSWPFDDKYPWQE